MIGILDSGIGGCTVLDALRVIAPRADVVYFADVAGAPYGSKDDATIAARVRGGLRILRAHGATTIAVACHTASVIVSSFPESIEDVVTMVDASVTCIADASPGRCAIVATPATIRSGVYARRCRLLGIIPEDIPTADLAPVIESAAPRDTIASIVAHIADAVRARGCDAVLLGCTHFPIARPFFDAAFATRGANMRMIDPTAAVAAAVAARTDVGGGAALRMFVSADSATFAAHVAARYPGVPMTRVG
jgi:glutamate racemase